MKKISKVEGKKEVKIEEVSFDSLQPTPDEIEALKEEPKKEKKSRSKKAKKEAQLDEIADKALKGKTMEEAGIKLVPATNLEEVKEPDESDKTIEEEREKGKVTEPEPRDPRDIEFEEKKEGMMTAAGLNWTVRPEEVQTASGLIIPRTVAIIREDNNTILGIHKENYQIFQNEELLETLFHITKRTGLELHSGGLFYGGAEVYFQLKSDDLDLGGDKVEGYITGLNSFDGSIALAFGNSTLTISCKNTFLRNYRTVDQKIYHSASMRKRVEALLVRVDKLLLEEKRMFESIKRFTTIPIPENLREKVTKLILNIPAEDRLEDIKNKARQERLNLFNTHMDTEIAGKGENLWGLFSGITRFTTHGGTSDNHAYSKTLGKLGREERAIFDTLEKEF